MGLREDMAAECRKSKEAKADVCTGRLEITAAYRQETNNDDQELLMLATQGCRSGCRCIKAEARIEEHDGKQFVVARCNPDPRLVPFSDPHGR